MTNIKNYTAKEFVTSVEAAAFLGIKISYLYKLTHEKKIPHYSPFGNKLLFKVSDLRNLVEKGRVSTVEEVRQAASESLI